MNHVNINYVAQLQEFVVQRLAQANPTYEMTEKTGPPHACRMKACVRLTDGRRYDCISSYSTLMGAKQDAALVALQDLQRTSVIERTMSFGDTLLKTVRDATQLACTVRVFAVICSSASLEDRDTLRMILNMAGVSAEWQSPQLLLCTSTFMKK